MGYAMPTQIGHGIHFRQWARAFIIATNSSRVVFVNVDVCMGTQVLKMQVSLRLYACTHYDTSKLKHSTSKYEMKCREYKNKNTDRLERKHAQVRNQAINLSGCFIR